VFLEVSRTLTNEKVGTLDRGFEDPGKQLTPLWGGVGGGGLVVSYLVIFVNEVFIGEVHSQVSE
jgi:hypothetical protein